MIFRNYYTGTLHEVPGALSNEAGQMVFDGFGNPVGGLFDDIGKAIGSIASVAGPIAQTLLPGPAGALIGGAANLVKGLVPGGSPAPPPAAPPAPMPVQVSPPGMPPMPFQAMPPAMPFQPGMAMPPGMPGAFPPAVPGWTTAPVPYTGLGPQRMYMRCAVWPGPPGLAPQYALNTPGAAPPPPATATATTTSGVNAPVIAPVLAPSIGIGPRPFHHVRHRR